MTKKVKLIKVMISDSYYDRYDDLISDKFAESITDWDEVSDEDYECLTSWIRKQPVRDCSYTILLTQIDREGLQMTIEQAIRQAKEDAAKRARDLERRELAKIKRKETLKNKELERDRKKLNSLKIKLGEK